MYFLSKVASGQGIQRWTKCEIFLEFGQKLRQKCEIFTNFQNLIFKSNFPLKLQIFPSNSKISWE